MALTLEDDHDALVDMIMCHAGIAELTPCILKQSTQRHPFGHADRFLLTSEGVKEVNMSIWVQTEVGSSMGNVHGKVTISLFVDKNRVFITDTFIFLPRAVRYNALIRHINQYLLALA
jgi:hypothetical protein